MIFINSFIVILTCTIIVIWVYLRITKKVYIINLVLPELLTYYPYLLLLFIITLIILVILTLMFVITLLFADKINLLLQKFIKTPKKQNNFWKKLHALMKKYNIFFRSYEILFNYFGAEYTQYILYLAKHCQTYTKLKNMLIIFFFVGLPRC